MIVVVEWLTKYRHFVALKHPFTTLTVAAQFVIEMVRLHGFPNPYFHCVGLGQVLYECILERNVAVAKNPIT